MSALSKTASRSSISYKMNIIRAAATPSGWRLFLTSILFWTIINKSRTLLIRFWNNKEDSYEKDEETSFRGFDDRYAH